MNKNANSADVRYLTRIAGKSLGRIAIFLQIKKRVYLCTLIFDTYQEYTCNKITETHIQIYRQIEMGYFHTEEKCGLNLPTSGC